MTDGETGHHHLEKREGSTYMLSKTFTRPVFGIMAALLAIALACAMPCLAFAADDSLGLAIARSIVDAHGGIIEAILDEQDLVITFTVHIPAK